MSRVSGNQSEETIAVDPTNPDNVVTVSNSIYGSLFLGVSHDGGQTWASRKIARGGKLGHACCDPSMTWDASGTLFLSWLDAQDSSVVPIAVSTDAGEKWSLLKELHPPKPKSLSTRIVSTRLLGWEEEEPPGRGTFVDQPTITAAEGKVWLAYHVNGQMQAAGARITGPGTVGKFHFENVPGTRGCSFGDISIGPSGQVYQVCTHDIDDGGQRPTRAEIRGNLDPDGLGPAPFGRRIAIGNTNVAQFDAIRPQERRTIDAETGLAWDRTGGPNTARLYLVYTDEKPDESDNTDVWVRYSDDLGATWSDRVKVNDDGGIRRAQFLPRIAIDETTGWLAIGFHDCRNDNGDLAFGDTNARRNDDAMYYLAFSTDGGSSFGANIQVSAGVSNARDADAPVDFGDYSGLAFESGVAHPSWADNSDSTGDNPAGALRSFDIYSASVTP